MQETQHASWLIYPASILITCVMHALIYYTLFHRSHSQSHNFGIYFCILLFLLNLCFFLLHRSLHLYYSIDLITSLALGVSFLFFVGAIFYYLILSPIFLFGTKAQYQYFAPYVRYAIILAVTFASLYGFYNGFFKQPVLKNVTLMMPQLKSPLRVLQISDLHISTLSSIKNLEGIILKANKTNPDIIVLTGDIIDSETEFIAPKIHLLSLLNARYGVFYVLGNHEYYHDTKNILNLIKNNKITILNNNCSTIYDADSNTPLINIIGITDFAGERMHFLAPDIVTALLKATANIPSILLAHQPKVIQHLPKDTKIELILSGHTHGGQIFPFNLLARLQQPFIKGLHKLQPHSYIYVSQGSGTWGPPMRLGTENEITLFNLLPQES